MENTISHLEPLVRETRKPESEVMTMAFQVGVRQRRTTQTPNIGRGACKSPWRLCRRGWRHYPPLQGKSG